MEVSVGDSVGGGVAVEGTSVLPGTDTVSDSVAAGPGAGGGGVEVGWQAIRNTVKNTAKTLFMFVAYFPLSSISTVSASTTSSRPSTVSILLVRARICSSTTSDGQNSINM